MLWFPAGAVGVAGGADAPAHAGRAADVGAVDGLAIVRLQALVTPRRRLAAAGGRLVGAHALQAAIFLPTLVVLIAQRLAVFPAAGAVEAAHGVHAHCGAGARVLIAPGAATAAGVLGQGRVVRSGAILVGDAPAPVATAITTAPVAAIAVASTAITASVAKAIVDLTTVTVFGPIISRVAAVGRIGVAAVAGAGVIGASDHAHSQ
jgi:hypothetical protein